MKLCIVATGYVGLVSGVCLASKGHEVVISNLHNILRGLEKRHHILQI